MTYAEIKCLQYRLFAKLQSELLANGYSKKAIRISNILSRITLKLN